MSHNDLVALKCNYKILWFSYIGQELNWALCEPGLIKYVGMDCQGGSRFMFYISRVKDVKFEGYLILHARSLCLAGFQEPYGIL